MMQKRLMRRWIAATCALAVLVSSGTVSPGRPLAAENSAASKEIVTFRTDDFGPYYQEVLADWKQKGYKHASRTITVSGASISAQSNRSMTSTGAYEGKTGVLIWKSDQENWIEYQLDVPEEGLYEIEMEYHPYQDSQGNSFSASRRPTNLSLQIDGSFPYREARAVLLRRKFKDLLPLVRDEYGDDIRPRPIELPGWMTEPLRDSESWYVQPLQWFLPKGRHTIRLTSSDPVVIGSIAIKPPQEVPDYQQASQSYPQVQTQSKEIIILQAEQLEWKNDVGLQMIADQDPMSEPYANGYERFNSIGGERWKAGGQTAAWKFEVPEDGRYRIGLRTLQRFVSNMSVFRTIAIDGIAPFQELLAYRFPYSPKWKGIILGDEEGNPFEIYLKKGTHTLSMTATTAPFQSVVVQGSRAMDKLRLVDQEIRGMTGGEVDKNRTWRVEQDFPNLPKYLEQTRIELERMAEMMLSANGRRDNTVQTIETAIRDLTSYLKRPNEIPYHMSEISNMIERIGAVRETLVRTPLQLDQIYIIPSGVEPPRMEAGFWKKMAGSIRNFFYSFTRTRDIGKVEEGVLNVWVNRGRDYVNLLQEMVNDTFTPETGIRVKVNLLPNENLLVLANAAGLSPDVAIGQPQDKSIDFAMRNALYDLSKFPDFKQTADQFAPGALLPFFYNGGYYALPETQSFKVMFYRKDIISRLGLSIPDTWQDVYEMLPTLQQKGYNFYVPAGDYLTFFYQNGAEFFAKNGMKTNMNTPEAFKGFKQWVDLFNIYDLEKSVPSFYQHFRKGTFPIGVADYNMYVTLLVAAPELAGWWGIAPIPGVKQADGTVSRWASGGQSTGFIYKNTKYPQESWEFLKWLLSADAQERYGSELESLNGVQFRWNTANVEAFTRLPWQKDDLKVILEQWRWYKEAPNLPGSYFLSREMTNAWNRTVVDGLNYRESLEEAIVNIDREMLRKEQEFGFVDAAGKIVHTLDLPEIKNPWEGVDKYVAK
ncbi:extracellular solute-binding protein [Paenibacillus koleovorans]|uniref:extracellular solute-binding protein n=1 Tax=Paenibacillus koleovorans TaxID=121608 RepID=UPI000FD86738|nr:extracellular solute-binding protein [Paenibacillus koleovorans]